MFSIGQRVIVGGTWLGEQGTIKRVAEHADPTQYLIEDDNGIQEWVLEGTLTLA